MVLPGLAVESVHALVVIANALEVVRPIRGALELIRRPGAALELVRRPSAALELVRRPSAALELVLDLLDAPEPRVEPAGGEQLVGRPLLDHHPAVQHDDPVRLLRGPEPVSGE